MRAARPNWPHCSGRTLFWDGRELRYGIATGPESIAKLVLEHFDAARPIIHMPGPPLLTVTPDGDVEGICWCLATRLVDGRTAPMIYFYYHDLMRCDAQGRWRFARRFLRSAVSRCGSRQP